MRKKVITLGLLATALTASADDYNYLTIESADGAKTSLTALGLTIKFTSGNLVATNGSESATIALGELSAMRFSTSKESSDTGISNVEADNFNISEADTAYDLSGRRISLSGVRKGVYIIKKGNQTKKIQVK